MTSVGYTLSVNDSPLDAAALGRLKRVEVEEHASLADVLRLTFNTMIKADASGWEVLDDGIFTRLSKIKLTLTVGSGTNQPLFEGYVVDMNGEFTNEPTENTLNVVAFDSSVLMNLEEKVRAWVDMADSDIASTIFGEYGFTPDVESTQPTRTEAVMSVMQRGTDIQFLRMLARRNGYACYVELDPSSGQPTGHFHPPIYDETPQGVISIGLGAESNVKTLKVQYNLLRAAQAAANNVDVDTLEAQPVEITSVAAQSLGADSTLPGDKVRKLLIDGTGLALTGELQTFAQAVTDRSALALRAEGEVNTQAYHSVIRAKHPILVRGVGREWSGAYYVERVLHLFEGTEHTQTFSLRRNATGLGGQEDFTAENG